MTQYPLTRPISFPAPRIGARTWHRPIGGILASLFVVFSVADTAQASHLETLCSLTSRLHNETIGFARHLHSHLRSCDDYEDLMESAEDIYRENARMRRHLAFARYGSLRLDRIADHADDIADELEDMREDIRDLIEDLHEERYDRRFHGGPAGYVAERFVRSRLASRHHFDVSRIGPQVHASYYRPSRHSIPIRTNHFGAELAHLQALDKHVCAMQETVARIQEIVCGAH